VAQDDGANLSHLVGLRVLAIPLQVDEFVNARAAEDVMAAAGALLESEMEKHHTQIIERKIRV
jgi:hypothetical protein